MTDVLSAEARSGLMSRIRGKNTKLELTVRRLVWAAGFRYRLHRRDLPGCPDMVFPGQRKAVFIHGCFWHGHDCTDGIRKPKTNQDYWIPKIARNQQRDTENIANLRSAGWDVIVVWECEMNDKARLTKKLQQFLSFSAPN